MKALSLTLLLLASAPAQAAPLACLIEPDKVAEVGAEVIGVLEKIHVERGDTVKAGQIAAQLTANVERASVNVAEVRARADAELHAAVAAAELAKSKAERAEYLVSVGFVSEEAADQTKAEARIARDRVAQAREVRRLAQRQLELSHSQLAQRIIRVPFSGIVVDRYHTEGERIEREPVIRIAKIDPLRVELVLPLSQFGEVKLGDVVNIKTGVTGEKPLPATVTLVDRVADAASNSFRVRLSLPNPDKSIPAGLRCVADFPSLSKDAPKPAPESGGGFSKISYEPGSGSAPPRPKAPLSLRLSSRLENLPSR